jgi:MarR family protease production transcriptional regulator HPr
MDQELNKMLCQSILIVRGLSRAIENSWEAFGRKNGISPAHQHILYLLWHTKELTISRLAETGLWHISTVTRLLRPLINDGLVKTYDNQQDGRSVNVRLSSKGYELIENLYREAMNDINFLPFVRELWETNPDLLKQSIEKGFNILEVAQGKQYADWARESELK